MTRLTSQEDWKGQASPALVPKEIIRHYMGYEWTKIVRRCIRIPLSDCGEYTYIELGGCPGYISDAILEGLNVKERYIFDFVDCQSIIETGNETSFRKFVHADLLMSPELLSCIDGPKVVTSFGLVEHFTDDDFDKIINVHTSGLRSKDLLVIEFPNLTGLKYFWHWLFDRPNLRLHNLDIMKNPQEILRSTLADYEVLFDGWTDPPYVWGNTSVPPTFNRLFIRVLYKFEQIINLLLRLNRRDDPLSPRPRFFSAFYLLVLRKR